MAIILSKRTEQIEKELQSLKDEMGQLAGRKETVTAESTVPSLIKQMIDEREKTNRLLGEITAKIGKLEKDIDEIYEGESGPQVDYEAMSREVPLSNLDSRILDFIQSKGMICADDLVEFMKYKGRNAACSRLNKLYRQGIVDRYQLGHKVFYKFDAGKATNTLIISPPQ